LPRLLDHSNQGQGRFTSHDPDSSSTRPGTASSYQRGADNLSVLTAERRRGAQQGKRPAPLTSSSYSNSSQTSFNWRAGRNMAGMLDMERTRTRRERTFIGSECAVCEEPLEHTLRGERILQFSCGHVSHEACFYEYIKEFEAQYCPTCNAPLGLDTSRGGNVLDLGKRTRPNLLVRSLTLRRETKQHCPLRFFE
jgi:hypothetical protein